MCTADASGDGVVDYREGVVTLARSRYMCFCGCCCAPAPAVTDGHRLIELTHTAPAVTHSVKAVPRDTARSDASQAGCSGSHDRGGGERARCRVTLWFRLP